MATALYGTMLTTPGNVEAIRRYLYAPTEIVEAAQVVRYDDGADLVFLVLRTEDRTEADAVSAQQQQCDRLASGMHALTIGFQTRYVARQHAATRALDNGWGLGSFAPFVVGASA